jgi:hypothetical protein
VKPSGPRWRRRRRARRSRRAATGRHPAGSLHHGARLFAQVLLQVIEGGDRLDPWSPMPFQPPRRPG